MNKFFTLILITFFIAGLAQGQSLMELKEKQQTVLDAQAEAQAKVDELQGEVDALQKEIEVASGWRKGFNGLLGFDWNNSSGWIASPNPDAQSSSLSLNLTGYAMSDKEKSFWHNKGVFQKAWQDVDLSDADDSQEGDGLFDNGTVDILNLSSLAGLKLSDKFALSGLGELNTSLSNFLSPGTFDIGVGVTWLPVQNMTVVIHPLNFHAAWPADGGSLESQSALGAKVRVDYFKDFGVAGKNINWTTTLTSFIPYADKKQDVLDDTGAFVRDAGLREYTWINTLSFEIWNGIGVGIGFGLRNSDLESSSVQTYQTLGLSYGF